MKPTTGSPAPPRRRRLPDRSRARTLALENLPDDSAKNWLLKSLIAAWATDRLNDNARAVHIHGKVLVYTRLPDGSFTPPPGITTELVQLSDAYELRERFGAMQRFEPIGDTHRLVSWSNVDGQRLSLSYNSDGQPTQITDAYGRSFQLHYNADRRITRISDSTGRDITYTYDAQGNQTAYTDPDGHRLSYHYNEPATHYITELRLPDDRILTQNYYDARGRVWKQKSEGQNPWYFYWSDYRMIERDPTAPNKATTTTNTPARRPPRRQRPPRAHRLQRPQPAPPTNRPSAGRPTTNTTRTRTCCAASATQTTAAPESTKTATTPSTGASSRSTPSAIAPSTATTAPPPRRNHQRRRRNHPPQLPSRRRARQPNRPPQPDHPL